MNGQTEVKIVNADPSAVGLFGLAMVTLVASSQKLGLTGPGIAMVIPWALFLGGIAQLFACLKDCKRNNLFGTVAFGAYGLFWLGVSMSWLINMGALGEELAKAADAKQLGVAFIGYLIFSIYMTIASTQTNKVLFIIFIFIDLLFIGLSLSSFHIAEEFAHNLGAYSELIVALLSFYGSAGCVLNSVFGKVILPQGKPIKMFGVQGAGH